MCSKAFREPTPAQLNAGLGQHLLLDMFTTEEMAEVFSERSLLDSYVTVERALASAQGRLGIIPSEAAQQIVDHAQLVSLNLEVLRQRTKVVGYPILPLVEQLAASLGTAGGFLHWGATTQDIMDTATVLQVRKALGIVERDLQNLCEILRDMAVRYRDVPMAGRTHLQQALPVTFGLKVAVWLSMIERHQERLNQLKPRVLVAQLGGAAGTLASLGTAGLAVHDAFAKELELFPALVAWHVARDGFAETVQFLGLLSGSLGKIGIDVALLMSTELGEVSEPFMHGRGASSTMPQKQNPISSEILIAAAKVVRQHCGSMLDAQIQDLERATGPWHVEWLALPAAFQLTAAALTQACSMLDGLTVDAERMRANLHISGGLIVAEAVMMALAPAVGRQPAHELVYDSCRIAADSGRMLIDVLRADPKITRHLSHTQIGELTDPARYLGSAGAMIDRVLAGTKHPKPVNPSTLDPSVDLTSAFSTG